MISSLIFALATVAEATPPVGIDPIQAFKDVCLGGRANFSKGQIHKVDKARLPWRIALAFRGTSARDFYVSQDDETVIATEPAVPGEYQHCSVVTMHGDRSRIYELGIGKLSRDTHGVPLSRSTELSRVLQSPDGYTITATRFWKTGLILTSSIAPPDERPRAAEQQAKQKQEQ